jgi:hypothetical protein
VVLCADEMEDYGAGLPPGMLVDESALLADD